jgi:hypothetical protein
MAIPDRETPQRNLFPEWVCSVVESGFVPSFAEEFVPKFERAE